MIKISIPKEINEVSKILVDAGFEAYLVGGCVRDLLLRELGLSRVEGPKDWDVATNAKPEEVQKLFKESVYENQFGTVLVKLGPRTNADSASQPSSGQARTDAEISRRESALSQRKSALVVEVTTFRLEGKYTDKRHPDEIKFAKTIEEDLSRRDFTINAMALQIGIKNDELGIKERNKKTDAENSSFIIQNSLFKFVDPYGGQEDLKNGIIRTVGNPRERFNEDALRLIRAVRFAAELNDFSAKGGPASGWKIEERTREAVKSEAGLLEMIAKERIRDEFEKIIMSSRAAQGVILLEDLGLLKYVSPELREGIGVSQNLHHIYTVFEHSVRCLDYAAKQNYSLEIRLASLFHDLGKPKAKEGEGYYSTFHGHEMVGAKMAARALERLHFSKEITERVVHLVRYHMFYYNVGEVSEAGVRRFLARVGPENVDDLLKVREADRIGSGVPKAVPYKNRHLLFMIEKVKRDPLSPKMLKVNGEDVMKIAGIKPGPRVGQILAALLEEVIDDPVKNEKKYLEKRIKELIKLSDKELEKLKKKAKAKKEEFESGVEGEMKKKYHVK